MLLHVLLLGTVAVTYDASSRGCPSAETFREDVAKRRPNKGGVVLGDDRDAKMRAQVSLRDGERGETKAKVRVSSGDRIIAEREVTGRNCEEVAKASALVVAVFADHSDEEAEAEGKADADAEGKAKAEADAKAKADAEAKAKADADAKVVATSVNRDATTTRVTEPKHVAIEANLLSLLAHRFSMQVEWVPGKHHAVLANPFFFHAGRKYTQDGVAYDLGDQNGLGAELGYRYYTGSRGPNGFFVGPSLVFGSFYKSGGEAAAIARPSNDGSYSLFTLDRPENYNAYGAALDIGGQFIVGPGVLFGIGVGAQYLFTTDDKSGGISSIIEGTAGFSPRVLASLGYAF